jgi:hypothetical protein
MKKINISYKTILTLTALFMAVGCKKITDINVSPNNPSIDKATPQVLFPSGVQSTAGRVGGELAILGGIWSQYWTQSNASNQYKDIDSYNLQRQSLNGNYNSLFSGALSDYQLTIQQAQSAGPIQYYLMATVMKAYTYQVLVDLYDQVPYTEALQGQTILQPKFDDGYTIYTSLLGEIDAALAATTSADDLSADIANTDFVFNGNMENWRKFANTLKLKMYLRMVNAKPAEAKAGIDKLYADNVAFLDIDAGVSSYVNTPDQGNPFYEYNIRRLNTPSNLRASKTFTSWLLANGDPRVVSYFGTANPTPQNQGDFNATAIEQPTYANSTVAVQSPTDPVWFISAAESYFMQAEALERYEGRSGATPFQQGVEAAFAQYDLEAPTTGVYVYPSNGTFEQKLKAIIVQKWASLPGSHALEAFFEQERTGYPEISPVYSTDPSYADEQAGKWVYPRGGVTGGKFAKRLVYPDSERSRNPNTPPEVPITTPVWWGKTN